MGKSPGKWIKTVLFGKKHSKSNSSKNATLHRKASAKAPVEDLENPVISNPVQLTDKGAETLELEKGTSGTPGGTIAVDQGLESQNYFVPVPVSDDEMRRQHQAATKVQAVFRGYLARRAFRALKGIIRLQALIRGHLVRRQAVATLRCMQAIVKFQALARGRRVRLSNTKPEVGEKYSMEVHHKIDTGAYSSSGLEKLATNAYVRKLLPFLPTAMPLSLQYDQAEPNSAWSWLQRWSVSRFWEPPIRTKKVSNTKPQRKQGGSQLNENESGKSRRTTRKVSNGDNGAVETDKPKRNPRKVTSQQTELVQEQPQSELERVKRSLKKVSTSVTVAPQKPEMETEKPQQQLSSKTVLNSAVPEKETAVSAETPADSDIVVDKISLPEAPLKTEVTVDKLSLPEAPLKTEVTVDVPNDDPCLVEMHSSENGEKMEKNSVLNDEKSPKGDEVGKENHKIRKRRSLSSKQEYSENISLNTPSIPSYMAATQSAKAKLRIHGSPKFSEDGAEVGYVRRHSLPASTNGKLSSLSPRIQKPVQANGKGSSKTNRPITTSSRDDKVLQPGWRR